MECLLLRKEESVTKCLLTAHYLQEYNPKLIKRTQIANYISLDCYYLHSLSLLYHHLTKIGGKNATCQILGIKNCVVYQSVGRRSM